MSSLFDMLESCYGTKDLYQVLGVEKEADHSQLRRAYLRLSLKVHPDRVPAEQIKEATEKFQALGKVYAILNDSDQRAVYDQTGTLSEEEEQGTQDWTQYWRLLFSKVDLKDIKSFEESYKGSAEEHDSLKSLYLESEGDMDVIMDEVLCACGEDETRFRELLEGWITDGSLPSYPAFTHESKRKRNARKRRYDSEAAQAELVLKQLKSDGGENSLKSLIASRQKSRAQEMDTLFSSLEKKYCYKKPRTEDCSGTSRKKKHKK